MRNGSTLWHGRRVLRAAALSIAAAACMTALGAAQAQTRPALVRSVDEPARVPYGGTLTPTCLFTNSCTVEYPVVPAGKRLRVTAIAASVRSNTSTASHILVLHRNEASGTNMISLWTMPPLSAAYYLSVASTHQMVDVFFEAGDHPVLEVGLPAGAGGITASNAKLTLTGYLVDVAP